MFPRHPNSHFGTTIMQTPTQATSLTHGDPSRGTTSLPDVYSPLQDGQIRLLQLTSGCSEHVELRMQTVDQNCSPACYALSYGCGDQPSSCTIIVDGRPFSIKPNLFAALRRLVMHFEIVQVERPLLWIDAISIHQSDLEERSQQVREMHRVFSGAEEVLVWLGDVPAHVQLILDVVDWYSLSTRYLNAAVPWWREYSDLPLHQNGSSSRGADRLEHLNSDVQSCFAELACGARLLRGDSWVD